MKCLAATIVLAICLIGIGKLTAQDRSLNVVATTTIVADVARNIGGDLITVTSLVPPDADVHAFEPTPQDALTISEADMVLAVGAGYEAFLAGLEENATDIVTISNGITIYPFAEDEHDGEEHEEEHIAEPVGILGVDGICDMHHDEQHSDTETTEEADHEHGVCDPHVWTNPANVMIWADNIATVFGAADPANAETYLANAETYKQQLVAADECIREILSVVPQDRRVLVTSHEFMNYFARAYDFEVLGVVIPGGTTGGETDPQSLAELIVIIQQQGIPAIFAEATANTRVIDAIAEDAGVQVVTTLSESLTSEEGVASTYLDYLQFNAQVIVNALTA